MSQQLIGIFKWYDQDKKFGLIGAQDGKEYFFHISNAPNESDEFHGGEPVLFEMGYDENKRRELAINPKKIDNKDFEAVLELLESKCTVRKVKEKTLAERTDGEEYEKVKIHDVDLFDRAWDKISSSIPEDVHLDLIKNSLEYLNKNRRESLIKFAVKILDISKRSANKESVSRKVLIEKFVQVLPDDVIIELWRQKLLEYSKVDESIFKIKDHAKRRKELIKSRFPRWIYFDVSVFIENAELLSKQDLLNLTRYKVSDADYLKIIKSKFSSNLTVDNIKEIADLSDKLEKFAPALFDHVNSLLDNSLLIEVWAFTYVSIDFENRRISKQRVGSSNFLSDEFLLNNYTLLSLKVLEVIVRKKHRSDQILFELLTKIFNKPGRLSSPHDIFKAYNLIQDNETKDELLPVYVKTSFEKSLEYLVDNYSHNFFYSCIEFVSGMDEEFRERIKSKLIPLFLVNDSSIRMYDRVKIMSKLGKGALAEFYKKGVNKFSDSDKVVFLEIANDPSYNQLTIDEWNFENANATSKLVNIIDVQDIRNNESFISKVKSELEEYNFSQLMRMFKKTGWHFLTSEILNKISLKFSDEYNQAIPVLDDSERKSLYEKFKKSFRQLNFIEFCTIVSTFYENKTVVDREVIVERMSLLDSNEFEKNIETVKSLHELYPVEVEASINHLMRDINVPSLEILTFVESKELIISILKQINVSQHQDVIISCFNENEGFKSLDDDFVSALLTDLLQNNFLEIVKITVENYSTLLPGVLQNFQVTSLNIHDVISVIEQNLLAEYSLNVECSFKVVDNFIREPLNVEFINKINHQFQADNYSYQLPIFKYLVYKYYSGKLSEENLITVLKSIHSVQLSALLFKKFIVTNTRNREQLMQLMNQLLKEHFRILNDKNLNNESFDQIFSLSGLVKKCNGRKKIEGAEYWSAGNAHRYYTDGNHFVSKIEKLDIYCEGRFWKKQPFYDKETNKPTGEKCDLFWCQNKICVGVNDEVDLTLPYFKWTLNELNEIFSRGLDRLVFTYLAGWLNRMEVIIEKLVCYDCGEVLRPLNFVPKRLGYYAVPLFHCVNEECGEQNKKVRFTHCRGCHKILDNRDCKTCEVCGWLICDNGKCNKCGCGANHTPIEVQYPNEN